MAQHLYSIHDSDPAWMPLIRDSGMTGFAVISESIGDDPTDHSGTDYRHLASYNVTPIVRLNYSHHGRGTIPLPANYNAFAQRCANFVTASSGCRHWLIGNEPNLAGERYDGIPILPSQYADCFAKCRNAIKQRSSQHDVIVAAIAPYNVDTGWCLDYQAEMLKSIARSNHDAGADGIALHTYSRGANPASITSDDKMDPPYDAYYNGFRSYRDQLALVPAVMRALPVYITETDQLEPWADINSGWVENAYWEIDYWNQGGGQGIHCLALYRWQRHDQWYIAGKNGVVDDFRNALTFGFAVPDAQPEPPMPEPEPEPPEPEPRRDIDPALYARGVTITAATVMQGEYAWRVDEAVYYPYGEGPDDAQGRHNNYVDVRDEHDQRAIGTPITHWWSSGSSTGVAENKSDPWMPGGYALDFPFNATWPSYGVKIDDGIPSDEVWGLGYGDAVNPNHHTSSFFKFVKVLEGDVPEPPIFPLPPVTSKLIWPCAGTITQRFGENPSDYARFGAAGHNGIDIAAPLGTPIKAIADGEVMFTGDDVNYGLYVRIYHESIHSHSFYAHLSAIRAAVGQRVRQGDVAGLCGSTGFSTGSHCHLELRGGTRDSYYPATYGHSKGRYDPMAAYIVTGSPLEPTG